jgi:sterol desaturase/sphingolipid hydroxylase (fatty acid hydroxylase superfamily)
MLLELADYYSALFLAPFLALEFFWAARRYDAPRGWRWRAAAVSLAVFGVSLAVGRAWGTVLPQWSLVNGAALGTWGGAAVGILVYELMHYWYHRLAHRWDLILRMCVVLVKSV